MRAVNPARLPDSGDAGDRPNQARATWDRARRPRPCLSATNQPLRDCVVGKLTEDWSPEQISGLLARTHTAGSGMRISHETVYQSLFIRTRGVLAKALQKHLRSGRPKRRHPQHRYRTAVFTDQGRSVHRRAPHRSRRPRGSWPPGGRPATGPWPDPDRHGRRTFHPLQRARSARRAGRGHRHRRAVGQDAQAARPAQEP
ncbi:helix-turn-helix domain-containing protein (plasmid) [Streptomyces sp. BHT-5-2]|nr:helix-turn-helix domain-containing protein [Streptomyces sp. BHT-5-2]